MGDSSKREVNREVAWLQGPKNPITLGPSYWYPLGLITDLLRSCNNVHEHVKQDAVRRALLGVRGDGPRGGLRVQGGVPRKRQRRMHPGRLRRGRQR